MVKIPGTLLTAKIARKYLLGTRADNTQRRRSGPEMGMAIALTCLLPLLEFIFHLFSVFESESAPRSSSHLQEICHLRFPSSTFNV